MHDGTAPAGSTGIDDELLDVLEETAAGEREPAGRGPDGPVREELSFPQRQIWFFEKWTPGTPTYNIGTAHRGGGDIDPEILLAAFAQTARRHPALRTAFGEDDGTPFQEIRDQGEVPFTRRDLRRERPSAEDLAAMAEEEVRRPFDLTREPPFRVLLLDGGRGGWTLVLTVHHIVADGRSMRLIMEDVSAAYTVLAAGGGPAEPGPAPHHFDAVRSRLDRWEQGALAPSVDHWRDRLGDRPEHTGFPADHRRPAVQTFTGRTHRLALPRRLVERVQRTARAEGATPYAVWFAAFSVLLGRYANQEDIVVGAPVSSCASRTDEATVGLMVNTVPLRVRLAPRKSFRDAIADAHGTVIDALEHSEVPFERLVAALGVQRDPAQSPIVQVVFGMDESAGAAPSLAGSPLTPVAVDRRTAKFDMTWLIDDTAAPRIDIEYNDSLYTPETVARIGREYLRLLERLLGAPDADAVTADFLGERPAGRLNADAPPIGLADGDCVHARIAEWARRTPEATAVQYGDQRIGYRELDERAGRLARVLRGEGVRRGGVVGVRLERGIDMIVSLLAVFKAGGAYLPLAPSLPAERTRFMLDDAGAAAVVTAGGPGRRPPEGPWAVVDLDRREQEISAAPPVPAHQRSGLDDLAYVIYTSGSTGLPKGVQATHRNIARLFPATGAWTAFGPSDVWTMFHEFTFDVSVWEIWGALSTGGRLVTMPKEVTRSPEEFLSLVRETGTTVLSQTPSAFRNLVEADAAAAEQEEPALRHVLLAGEAVDMAAVGQWFERHGDSRPEVANLYGITETTVHSTYRRLRAADVGASSSPIGVPLADLRIEVLDRWGNPTPPMTAGEIHVGGGGVTRGYLGRPGLTAERFVPDPRAGGDGSRLYRSGDLARVTGSGELEYIGRDDHQVKIRGFRIETGEVEAALTAHPAVEGAVVVPHAAGDGRPARLIGYVKTAGGESTAGLRDFLAGRLPDYMVPALLVPVQRWPLTSNGKVDRRALPAPGADRPDLHGDYTAPRGGMERALVEVFQEVLGIDRIGVHDSFFDLGGDSIRSLQITGRAKRRGIDVPLRELFLRPTVAELGAVASWSGTGRPGRSAPFSLLSGADRALLPAGVVDAYPMSVLQTGMQYHMELDPENLPYHNVNSVHVRMPFDGELFRRAAEDVVARHPVLRTSFDLAGYEQPTQLVWEAAEMPLIIEDLRHLDADAQAARLRAFVDEERSRPFDHERPPMARMALHRRGDTTVQWTVTEHHAILDGWSLKSFEAEVLQRYLALRKDPGAPAAAPPEPLFREFVRLELEALDSSDSSRFWKERTAGRAPVPLPVPDREEAAGAGADSGIGGEEVGGVRQWRSTTTRSGSQRSLEALLPAELSRSLLGLAAETGVPLKSVLLTAHLKVLGLVTGSPDAVAGMSSHGRPEEDGAAEVYGMFLNIVPVRLPRGCRTWADLIRSVFGQEQDLIPHRRYPLALMQRDAGGRELFDNTFLYNHFHVMQDVLGDEIEFLDSRSVGTTDYRAEPTDHTLSTGFLRDPRSERLLLRFDYYTGRLGDAAAEEMRSLYLDVLAAMTDSGAEHEAFAPRLGRGGA
ncbi:non-ribosomal peptide synthetase [Nocardiopsis potens]|uniref:non-ribosomal peptide synthetase n=1 Tax=Nocardiopsis potens TaxID=1246458 RepID=UPI00034D663C|nr:non-ribosomal peptide synthetase [Nocardiopsis potens]